MAKGVHSKRRKRNQSIKRKILDESKIIYYNNNFHFQSCGNQH